MKILIAPGAPFNSAAYLVEIFTAFGLPFASRLASGDARMADPKRDLLVLPSGCAVKGVEDFLRKGGNAIAFRPTEDLATLAGVKALREEKADSRLRLVQPVCAAARGEAIWTPSPVTVYDAKPDPGVIAWIYRPGDFASESTGIFEKAVGEGRLVIFEYDPAACILALRQGDPAQANRRSSEQTVPRASYMHPGNPPTDTWWRPTADLHARVLTGVARRLLERRAPVPSLWHLPAGAPSILLFSGDEDAAEQHMNDAEMRELEANGGSMNLYVIPDDTSITLELIAGYTRRGHVISVHPNMKPVCGRPPAEQVARAEEQVQMFREKFFQPVRTLRNHNYMWPGYVDLPELWEKLGIGMDANQAAYLINETPDLGPYVTVNAAVPLRYTRADGRVIDVFQQPTHVNDDLSLHPDSIYSQKFSDAQFEAVVERLFDEATRFFHSPVCANIHPSNYVWFSGGAGKCLMRRAKEFAMPIWNMDRWHDFWRARSSWRMSADSWEGGKLKFTMRGDPANGLSVMLPSRAGSAALKELRVGGKETERKVSRAHGQEVVAVSVPDKASEVEIEATYGTV